MANALAKTEEKDDIRKLLSGENMKKQFGMALPKHLTPDRFVRVALTAITKNPKLLQCTQSSLFSCLLDCSQLGLEPDGRKAHLIPYEDKKKQITVCTLIIDYKGLVDLARRSGQISDIHADIVCENDEFDYSYGNDGRLYHKPALSERGKILGAYSFVKLKDGSVSYEVMGLVEVHAIRDRSQGWKAFKAGYAKSAIWDTDESEMIKKTVFRRHSKWLPLSSEFQDAIEKDYDKPLDLFDKAITATPSLLDLPQIEERSTIPTQATVESVPEKAEEPKQERSMKRATRPAVNGGPKAKESHISQLRNLMAEAHKLNGEQGYDDGWLIDELDGREIEEMTLGEWSQLMTKLGNVIDKMGPAENSGD